jgi:hypothetical protein
MLAGTREERSGSDARNERALGWFRGLNVRNIAFVVSQIASSSGQVNAVCLALQLNFPPSSAAARLVAALMYGVCRPLSVYIHPIPCPRP